MQLRGVYFDWKDKDKRGTGVIAQETLGVLPEVVSYAKDIDQYSVAYGNIVGVLIEAIKEQQKQIDELKKKYKDEKEKMASELMALYKQEKVNPLSSCLPLLIQLPFLIAVYQVFRNGLSSHGLNLLYPFVANPGTINTLSLGFVDLLKPNIILAILAAAAQFFQTKMIQVNRPPKDKTGQVPAGAKDEDMMAIMNKQMLYFMPLMTVFIGASLPGGLTFYWFLTTVLTVLQQWWMFRKKKDNDTPGQEIIKSV